MVAESDDTMDDTTGDTTATDLLPVADADTESEIWSPFIADLGLHADTEASISESETSGSDTGLPHEDGENPSETVSSPDGHDASDGMNILDADDVAMPTDGASPEDADALTTEDTAEDMAIGDQEDAPTDTGPVADLHEDPQDAVEDVPVPPDSNVIDVVDALMPEETALPPDIATIDATDINAPDATDTAELPPVLDVPFIPGGVLVLYGFSPDDGMPLSQDDLLALLSSADPPESVPMEFAHVSTPGDAQPNGLVLCYQPDSVPTFPPETPCATLAPPPPLPITPDAVSGLALVFPANNGLLAEWEMVAATPTTLLGGTIIYKNFVGTPVVTAWMTVESTPGASCYYGFATSWCE